MAWTFKIGSTEFLVRRFPKPKYIPPYEWVKSWAENPYANDRGAAQDIYETEITFYGTETAINATATALDAVRTSAVLTSFSDSIFLPNVDHTGSITCAIKAQRPRKSLSFAAGGSAMYELTATLRAVAPPILTTSPSLATLRRQWGDETDKSLTSVKGFSMDQTIFTEDRRADIGTARVPFLQTTAEIKAILAYILGTARASSILFPSIGIDYPFGVVRGALPKACKITGFTCSPRDGELWNLVITFSEFA